MGTNTKTAVRKLVPGELLSNRISDIVEVVESAVKRTIVALGNDPERWGGYFRITCTTNNLDSRPLKLIPISFVPPQFAERLANSTLVATRRLREHPEHLSSRENLDYERNKYGCAIRVWTNYIFAFSGLPELANEAAMILAAHELDLMPAWQMRQILEASRNELALELTGLEL